MTSVGVNAPSINEETLVTWYQEWFGEDYLDLYAYRDDDEARTHVAFFKSRFGAVSGPVLDLACGGGRHAQELETEGYSVVGLDLSSVLLRKARLDSPGLRVARGDMRRLPFRRRAFSALVSFFTSFGYFDKEEENAGVVQEMARVLSPASPFLFDYLNLPRELDRLVASETRETDRGPVGIERWFDPSTRTFNKRIMIDGKRYVERVRGYDLEEITILFSTAGLVIRDQYGDFEGGPYHRDSERLIVTGWRT